MRRTFVAAAAFGLVVAMFGTAVAEGPPRKQTVPVMWHAQAITFDGVTPGPVTGASASLVATSSGASVTVQTSGLQAGHAYTLWYVIINNPEACGSRPCKAADIFRNEAVDAQVSYGAGQVVGHSGIATFSARKNTGTVSGWLPDLVYDNPYGAEYHFVVNDHGPKLAEHMPGMIRTYRGGCADRPTSPFPGIFPPSALAHGEPGPNRCLLTQVAVFQP